MRSSANKFFFVFILFITAINLVWGQNALQKGYWNGKLESHGGDLPFNFIIEDASNPNSIQIKIVNGSEEFFHGDSYIKNDSLIIPFELYDSRIIAHIEGDQKIKGYWEKKRNGKILGTIPLTAQAGPRKRFEIPSTPAVKNISGKYQADFFREGDEKGSPGVGIFEQDGQNIRGTFLKTSGDYRFLEGNIFGDSLVLSYFDGSSVYLFKSKISGDTIKGEFYSGFDGIRTFICEKNPMASLPDSKLITQLKEGYSTLGFQLPSPEGEIISLKDSRFKNKVVVIELLGSWCPNCMDESKFLAPFYDKHKDKGLEMLGLAFEYSTDMKVSGPKINRFKERNGIHYPVVLAGQPSSESALAVLPELNSINGYPTTILIDKSGKVREIETGFSGPGTGIHYQDWIEKFEKTIMELLNEK